MISAKFGEKIGGWCSQEGMEGYGQRLWKATRRGRTECQARTRFERGDSRRVRLWHDLWCGDSSLKALFPTANLLDADSGSLGGGGRCWTLKPLFSWKCSRLGSCWLKHSLSRSKTRWSEESVRTSWFGN